MRLINLTPIRKKKIIEMIKFLFPEYDNVVVKNSGLLILKKYTFLFFCKRELIPVTDIMLYELPKRLDAILQAQGIGDKVSPNIGSILELIIRCKSYDSYFDITDYIWSKFIKIKPKQEPVDIPALVKIEVKSIILPLYLRNLSYLKVIIRERLYKEEVSLTESIRQFIVKKLNSSKLAVDNLLSQNQRLVFN